MRHVRCCQAGRGAKRVARGRGQDENDGANESEVEAETRAPAMLLGAKVLEWWADRDQRRTSNWIAMGRDGYKRLINGEFYDASRSGHPRQPDFRR